MTSPGIHRRDLLKGAAGAVALGAVTRAVGAASPKPPEDRWQIGIYTRPWAKFDWRTALDAIAEAGYRYAGLMTTNTKNHLVISAATTLEEAHAVGEECRQRGLTVPSVYGGGIP